MRLSEFLLLGEEEKKKTVLHDAILISKRKNENDIVFLFQLEGLYIEAYCDMHQKAISSYQVSNNTSMIEPYLNAIPITGLFH